MVFSFNNWFQFIQRIECHYCKISAISTNLLSIDSTKGGVHGVSLDVQLSTSYYAEGHDFVDEQNFEDNGQITAIQLRAGSETIYAIRARLITYHII